MPVQSAQVFSEDEDSGSDENPLPIKVEKDPVPVVVEEIKVDDQKPKVVP